MPITACAQWRTHWRPGGQPDCSPPTHEDGRRSPRHLDDFAPQKPRSIHLHRSHGLHGHASRDAHPKRSFVYSDSPKCSGHTDALIKASFFGIGLVVRYTRGDLYSHATRNMGRGPNPGCTNTALTGNRRRYPLVQHFNQHFCSLGTTTRGGRQHIHARPWLREPFHPPRVRQLQHNDQDKGPTHPSAVSSEQNHQPAMPLFSRILGLGHRPTLLDSRARILRQHRLSMRNGMKIRVVSVSSIATLMSPPQSLTTSRCALCESILSASISSDGVVCSPKASRTDSLMSLLTCRNCGDSIFETEARRPLQLNRNDPSGIFDTELHGVRLVLIAT